MFCPNCGTESSDDLKICLTCGASLVPEEQPAQPVYQQPAQPVYQQPAQPVYQQPVQPVYQQPVQQYQQYYQPPVQYVKPQTPGRGFGISSMVLGIIGLVYAFFMFVSFAELADSSFGRVLSSSLIFALLLYSVMPILSLCFAPAAYKRGYRNGVSKSGLVLGSIALALNFISIMIVVAA